MSIQPGDRVRIRGTNSLDDGRMGIVDRLGDWYGQSVATVYFDDAPWDHSDRGNFYLFHLEKVVARRRRRRVTSHV